jgi:histidinol-phosphate aminotransferase
MAGLTRRQFAGTLGVAAGAVAGASILPAPAAAAPAPDPDYPEGTLRLDSNENPYGPSPRALDALKRARDRAARYPDRIETRLTGAIARHHGVEPENIVLGCGSGEVLRMADMAFLSAGRCVVAAQPTFEAVLAYARVTQARPVTVPLTADFRHDLPRMLAACPESAGLIYVCNPNNPTGSIVARTALQEFLDAAPAGVVVVVDEAYHDFAEDTGYASVMPQAASRPNLLVVRTFSKIHGLAGMRLGFGVAARPVADALRAHQLWSNTNAAVLEAAIASLADTAHLADQKRRFAAERARLVARLQGEGRRVIPSQTNFLMIEIGRDVAPVIAAFRDRRILVGRRFASMPTWLRISIGTPREMDAFVAALREIAPPAATAGSPGWNPAPETGPCGACPVS